MPYTLIKGKFHVKGYQPDGDSIRFEANDLSLIQNITGPNNRLQINAKNHVQLRFDGVDALETHYFGKHQPDKFAKEARTFVLDNLGIDQVTWSPSGIEVTDANDEKQGYILTRSKDIHGRIISFVFSGDISEEDGDQVFVDSEKIKTSLNYRLIEQGLGYPAFYVGLFSDLRRSMALVTKKSRESKTGLWNEDKTDAFTVDGMQSIEDNLVIFPKLFRRLSKHITNNNDVMTGFREYLEDNDDTVNILNTDNRTNLDRIIRIHGNLVGLDILPEGLLFVPQT